MGLPNQKIHMRRVGKILKLRDQKARARIAKS